MEIRYKSYKIERLWEQIINDNISIWRVVLVFYWIILQVNFLRGIFAPKVLSKFGVFIQKCTLQCFYETVPFYQWKFSSNLSIFLSRNTCKVPSRHVVECLWQKTHIEKENYGVLKLGKSINHENWSKPYRKIFSPYRENENL